MRILTHEHTPDLPAVAVSAQLVASRSALLVGVRVHFIARAPSATSACEQLPEDLQAMSEARAMAEGSVPLMTALVKAVARPIGWNEATAFPTRSGPVWRSHHREGLDRREQAVPARARQGDRSALGSRQASSGRHNCHGAPTIMTKRYQTSVVVDLDADVVSNRKNT